MFSKLIRILGLAAIILFCAISVLVSTTHRDIDPKLKKMFRYTSFFEDRFYDHRMEYTRDRKTIDDRLVLFNIDDESLNIIGRFPWTRKVWAKTMEKFKHFGAKVVAFDVVFPESEAFCGTEDPDQMFADAIKDFQSVPDQKVIIPYSVNNPPIAETLPDIMYNFMMDTKQLEGLNFEPSFITSATFPIQALQETDAPLAYIGTEEDPDGIFRHYRLAANFDTLYFPSFALMAYQLYTGDKPVLEILNEGEGTLKLKSGSLPLNFRGESKIRWLGGRGQFPEVKASDFINADLNDEEIRKKVEGKIVFIGSTAFGAHDLRHTPINAMMPGIFYHMNMTHMLLEGKFFKPKDDSTRISWMLLLIGSAIIIIVQLFNHAILDLVTMLTITLGSYFVDSFILLPKGYNIQLFFCIFSVLAIYFWNTFLNFYLTSKDKQFLKNAFGNYISPELIDQMYKSGEPPKLGGDCGVRTAFFTDIQSFSTFSEKLSATQLVELLNEYLSAMTDILLEEGGTLDKYEGDAIIAFFGAPMPQEDHAARALRVAQKMQDQLLELRKKWVSEGDKWPQIVHEMRMRIGINSGEIVTGNMGSQVRMNYTMMGDAVNLSARLESSAKQYGIFTQLAKDSLKCAGDGFVVRELDTVRVVGKSEPVTTFELLGIENETDDNLLQLKEHFEKGLSFYKEQKWDEASEEFSKSLECEYIRFPLLKGVKTNPSEIYIDRCKEFKANPPGDDWDGVYTLTSK